MKPNSCLYRAIRDVVMHQFQIDISPRAFVFDANNDGRGILVREAFAVVDEALNPLGIRICSIYGNFSEAFSHSDLCASDNYVPAPAIGYTKEGQHAIAVLPGNDTLTCNMAFTLHRITMFSKWKAWLLQQFRAVGPRWRAWKASTTRRSRQGSASDLGSSPSTSTEEMADLTIVAAATERNDVR